MYRRMLVPLDGSELSEVVFPYARELAGGLGLDVILLHVHSPVERGTRHVYRAYIKYQTEVMKRRLAKVVKKIGVSAEGKTRSVQGVVVEGYPAEEILRYAETKEIDFILMATHGYSGVKRWALGSVAEKVLHISKVPIWLVRASVPVTHRVATIKPAQTSAATTGGISVRVSNTMSRPRMDSASHARS